MRTLHGRKKKQRLTFRENCSKRDTILLQEEKRKKNNVNKLCKDDERTAKEGTNTNHRLTQPCCCGEAARTAHVQAEYGEHRSTAPR